MGIDRSSAAPVIVGTTSIGMPVGFISSKFSSNWLTR
eukprot:Gb_10086 [translate_table: standard]